jgi:hypothetical protein
MNLGIIFLTLRQPATSRNRRNRPTFVSACGDKKSNIQINCFQSRQEIHSVMCKFVDEARESVAQDDP